MKSKGLSWLGTILLIAGIGVLTVVGLNYAYNQKNTLGPSSLTPTPITNPPDSFPGQQTYQNQHLFDKVPAAIHKLGAPGVRMRIPTIGLDAPIIETQVINGNWQVADWAVGHLNGTANPGGAGNMVVAAHDDIKGEIFKRIGDLKTGQLIIVDSKSMEYVYKVSGRQVVSPYDSQPILNSNMREHKLTMITCIPYWVDTSRLIVTGTLASRHPLTATT